MSTLEHDRLVKQISVGQSLVEKGGLYLIKSLVGGNVCYRGVDKRYDLPEVVNLTKQELSKLEHLK